MRRVLCISLVAALASTQTDAKAETARTRDAGLAARDKQSLNFHLMRPGGASIPADPNAALFLDGVYHLHYISALKWNGKNTFAFIHVASPDMLHWKWQSTRLQPLITGRGVFSGTGFLT
jgi:sucrose-6-phosphate hydrolase SacC (GH32 family)